MINNTFNNFEAKWRHGRKEAQRVSGWVIEGILDALLKCNCDEIFAYYFPTFLGLTSHLDPKL